MTGQPCRAIFYLATVTDIASRHVVGHTTTGHPRTELAAAFADPPGGGATVR